MKYPVEMRLTAILDDINRREDDVTRGIIVCKVIDLLFELGYHLDDSGDFITNEEQ